MTAFWVASGALATALGSSLATRLGWLDWRLGLALFLLALLAATAALALGLLDTVRTPGLPGWSVAGAALALPLVVPAVLLGVRAVGAPPIHDITTDPEDPPGWVALRPAREEAPNGADYGGDELAEAQAEAYPEVQPLRSEESPEEVFRRARSRAEAMGWTVVDADPDAGRIEATATTPWFGFTDDIVIRVTATEDGARLDVRSASRVGKSDLGTNAERIRAFLRDL